LFERSKMLMTNPPLPGLVYIYVVILHFNSFAAIAGLFRDLVVGQQLDGDDGAVTVLTGPQARELGLNLLASTHFDLEPTEAVRQTETLADFFDIFCAPAR
jgi:hypothetical protein